jgi:hypothetical protein
MAKKMAMAEEDETPEMEAKEHSKGFLKRAAHVAGKPHHKKAGKKHSRKRVSK